MNHSLAHYLRGDIDVAKAAMRQALRSVFGHSAATANLDALMRISGVSDQAEARLNLASDLLQGAAQRRS